MEKFEQNGEIIGNDEIQEQEVKNKRVASDVESDIENGNSQIISKEAKGKKAIAVADVEGEGEQEADVKLADEQAAVAADSDWQAQIDQ